MNNSNRASWTSFWASSTKSIERAAGLISRVKTELSLLHRRHREQALVEIPAEFSSALSEITSEFISDNDNLGGLRPVVANLLEILKSSKHLTHKGAKRHVRSLLNRLHELFQDKIYEFAEENEHQVGLFDGVRTLLDDAISGSQKVEAALIASQKRAQKSIAFIQVTVKGAERLTKHAHHVASLKRKECRSVKRVIARAVLRFEKFLNVCGQLQEVLSDRFGSIKTFFVEESDEQTN